MTQYLGQPLGTRNSEFWKLELIRPPCSYLRALETSHKRPIPHATLGGILISTSNSWLQVDRCCICLVWTMRVSPPRYPLQEEVSKWIAGSEEDTRLLHKNIDIVFSAARDTQLVPLDFSCTISPLSNCNPFSFGETPVPFPSHDTPVRFSLFDLWCWSSASSCTSSYTLSLKFDLFFSLVRALLPLRLNLF